DEVLRSGVQGITDLISVPGLINLDFADVKSVMQDAGTALMGIGAATGDDRAVQAAESAIASPLLEASIDGAHGVLFCITGGGDLGLFEVNEAARLVQEAAHPEANIIFGAVIDDNIGDECRVTVIAAGLDNSAPNAETAGVEPVPAAVPASTESETETDSAAIETESEEPETSESASPRRNEEHQIPATLPSERSASNADSDLDIPDFLK